ncbi:guanylate kinase [Chloroflexota bacterium]
MSHEGHTPIHPPGKPLLLVLSGLSGVGKDTVLTRLRKSVYPLEFIVTVTTRSKRINEQEGIHYRFVPENEFRELIDHHELLEWANVYGNLYGVPREPVKLAMNGGKDVIVKVDVQGAATIKKILPQGVFMFLSPPSIEELTLRLKNRCTESPSDLDMRIKTAEEELEKLALFDYIVINRQGAVDRAVADIEAIIAAEKCRVQARELAL